MFGLLETCKLLVVTVVIYLLLSGCQEIFYKYEREASAVTWDQTSVHLWPLHQVLWSAFHLAWNDVQHCDSTWWRCWRVCQDEDAVQLWHRLLELIVDSSQLRTLAGIQVRHTSHLWDDDCVSVLSSRVFLQPLGASQWLEMSPVLQLQQVPAGPRLYLFISTEDLIREALNQSFLFRASSAQLGSDRWESLSLWVQCGSLESNLQF